MKKLINRLIKDPFFIAAGLILLVGIISICCTARTKLDTSSGNYTINLPTNRKYVSIAFQGGGGYLWVVTTKAEKTDISREYLVTRHKDDSNTPLEPSETGNYTIIEHINLEENSDERNNSTR